MPRLTWEFTIQSRLPRLEPYRVSNINEIQRAIFTQTMQIHGSMEFCFNSFPRNLSVPLWKGRVNLRRVMQTFVKTVPRGPRPWTPEMQWNLEVISIAFWDLGCHACLISFEETQPAGIIIALLRIQSHIVYSIEIKTRLSYVYCQADKEGQAAFIR